MLIAALLAIVMLAGCGRTDQLRAHNANMIADAAQAVEQTLKAEVPRIYAEHQTLKRDLDDLQDRNELVRRDHPWRGAVIERSTPDAPSKADVNMYCAYSAVVDREDAKRKEHAERWAWWRWLIWWLKAALYAAPFVGILILILWARARFFDLGQVQVKHIQATVPDKNRRREIAGGSMAERVFRKIRDKLPWSHQESPQDALSRDKSDEDVSVVADAEKTRESDEMKNT